MSGDYRSEDVMVYAVLLSRADRNINQRDLYARLRLAFPGIDDAAIDTAFDDGRRWLAIRAMVQVSK